MSPLPLRIAGTSTVLPGTRVTTPVDIDAGGQTYHFDATLSLGHIAAAVAQNDVDVPDGICTSFCLEIPIVGVVKAVA